MADQTKPRMTDAEKMTIYGGIHEAHYEINLIAEQFLKSKYASEVVVGERLKRSIENFHPYMSLLLSRQN